jgi:DNA-binding PadR family transcriptional regulator
VSIQETVFLKHRFHGNVRTGMSDETAGEFEQMVLLAILHVGDEAYGVPLVEEIRRRTERAVLRPAVYVALRRLERKGLVRSRLGEARPERGGRARKCYRVTAAGLDILRDARRDWLAMWDGLQGVLDEG